MKGRADRKGARGEFSPMANHEQAKVEALSGTCPSRSDRSADQTRCARAKSIQSRRNVRVGRHGEFKYGAAGHVRAGPQTPP